MTAGCKEIGDESATAWGVAIERNARQIKAGVGQAGAFDRIDTTDPLWNSPEGWTTERAGGRDGTEEDSS